MRSLMAACFAVLSLASAASFADQRKFSELDREVLRASEARRAAVNRRDLEAAAAFIADDCLFSTEYGALVTKSEYIEHRRNLPPDYDATSDPRDYAVRVHGDTAVINFLITDRERYVDTEIVSVQRRTEADDRRAVGRHSGKSSRRGSRGSAPYLPAGGATFFLKNGDLGSVSFVRDASGNVNGYT